MNRREFTRLSALALGSARLLPQAAAQILAADAKPVGYAAIGLGTISGIFMAACAKTKDAKITALVTGHPDEKGKKFAAMYGIPETSIYTYEQFDRIRENKDVDAVYVGLPNSMHREYTERAARAGKHVLCEKPMATSSADCRAMIAACKQAKVKLMIAYRCQYVPTFLEADRIIQAGEIGSLVSFEGAYGFNAGSPTLWRLNKKLAGGGPLMDVGIYPLNIIRYFTREEPVEYKAFSTTIDHTSGRFAQVEESLTWTMKFPSGVLATGATTYGAGMSGMLRIHGTKGVLEFLPAFHYTGTHLRSLGGTTHADMTDSDDQTYHFQLEAEHFAQCIREDKQPKTPGEEGLKDLLAIEAIYRSAGVPMG